MSRKKETMFAVLTGIIALGIFAAAYSSTQMLNAVAQTGEEQARQQSGVSVDEALPISAPYYHGYSGTPTVSTSGIATTKVKPDKFSVTVGVETNGTTAQEAADSSADLMEKVVAALKALGISEDQISTSNYSVYPVYSVISDVNACRVMEGFPIPPECYSDQTITGYKAVNSVTVTLDVDGDIDAGKVIDAAIGAGASNVNGVFFFISQEMQQGIRDGLIKEAIANARQRAEIAAEAVGMEITGVQSINLSDVYFPIYGRGAFDATVAETPFFPGEQEITNTVNVVFLINGSGGSVAEDDNGTAAADQAVATARQFILGKLPSLGIEIDDELDLHTDMLVHVSETEFHLDFSVLDVNGQSHDGHIEVVNSEITVAVLDGQSIL